MGTFTGYFVVTDKNGYPLNNITVELMEIIEFTPASPNPQEHIVATGTTDEAGEVTFGSLDDAKRYFARARRANAQIHVVIPTSLSGTTLAADSLWAAQGDLVKGTGDDAADILSIGAAYTVLYSDGTDPSWSAAPRLANIADTGGTNRITIGTARPTVTLTGQVKTSSTLSLMGTTPNAQDDYFLDIAQTETVSRIKTGIRVNPQLTGDTSARGFTGIQGAPSYYIPDGDTGAVVHGLNFTIGSYAFVGVGGTIAELYAIKARHASFVFSSGKTLTIADVKGLYIAPSTITAYAGTTLNITRWKGIHIDGHLLTDTGTMAIADYCGIHIEDVADAVVVNQISLKIDDVTAASGVNRILQLGPSPYYMVLEGSGDWTPTDYTTPLFLAADDPVVLHPVTVGATDSGGSGYRVLRIPNI